MLNRRIDELEEELAAANEEIAGLEYDKNELQNDLDDLECNDELLVELEELKKEIEQYRLEKGIQMSVNGLVELSYKYPHIDEPGYIAYKRSGDAQRNPDSASSFMIGASSNEREEL